MSRDDAEGGFLAPCLEVGILPEGPFEALDRDGVGSLVSTTREFAREGNPIPKLGISGEHAGDPESIEYFHKADLDYVFHSPHRVPGARIAARQRLAL